MAVVKLRRILAAGAVTSVCALALVLTKELVALLGWVDRVVPVWMELVAFDVHGGKLLLRDPTLHSVLADPRRTHDSRDPARPTRPSLRRRPQPALTLVQLRPQPPITLSNLRFIDHAPAIRHHNPTSCHSPLIHS